MEPFSSRWITCTEPRFSLVSTGPITRAGLTVARVVTPPLVAMKSHAACSAMTLDCG